MSREVRLPELGEEIESAIVLSVLVSPGDHVARDQPVVELETDKATTEVPSPFDGVIEEVLVHEGDEVHVGQPMLELREETEEEEEEKEEPQRAPEGEEAEQRTSAKREEAKEEPQKPRALEDTGRRDGEATRTANRREPPTERKEARPLQALGAEKLLAASPSVRRLARELGADLRLVSGTGASGRISEDDVKAYVRERLLELQARTAGDGEELLDLDRFGRVERRAMNGVRRATARSVARSWARVPHVTQFDDAEIGAVDAFLLRQGAIAEKIGIRVTLTSALVKVAALALRRFPALNSAVDGRSAQILERDYVHIGVAVDTEAGLLVPVIRDADQKPLLALAAEIKDVAERARARKLRQEEIEGASFSVTNLGALGTTYFTPIVAWPQVAILGVGKAEMRPVWLDGAFRPRRILPLSISYDHRAVDGAGAARFLRWIAESLASPLHLVM